MTPTPTLVAADRPPQTAIPPVTAEQLDLIRTTIAKGASDDELKLYLFDCARQGVHPLDKLIHFTKRSGRYAPITSIDFMRIRAAQTGDCAGIDDAVFAGDPKTASFAASVTVWRLVQGVRCAFTATARWSEYKPEQNDFMWQRMPFTMLGKCAEALALRRGFPQQLAGLFASEELDQAAARLDCDPVTGEIVSKFQHDTSTHAPLAKGYPDTKTITPAQRKRLFAIAREHGWTTDQLKAHLLAKYSLRRTSDLLIALYDGVCQELARGPQPADAFDPFAPNADADDQPF